MDDTRVQREQRKVRALPGDMKTEALVIGGGLAGVLTAWNLQSAGVKTVLVEATRIGQGVTGNTTAKVTAQHGLIYADLIKKQGREKAALYYDANREALGAFRRLAKDIPCDFEDKTAYVYSVGESEKLAREAGAYAALGIASVFQERPPLPLRTDGALGLPGQGQMNPLKLLYGLAERLEIYEDTFIKEISDKTAYSARGKITAEHIVLATHFPLVNIPGLYFLKMYQHRSYVIALKGGPQLDGMYLDQKEDGFSFRNYGDLLFIGGGDHKTGKKGGGYPRVRRLAERAYPNLTEAYAWATQDCMSLDKIPYIGVQRKGAPRLYVATGFNKWGMTGSMAAARTLTELITQGRSPFEALYCPQRSILQPQLFLNVLSAAGGLLTPGKRCPHMGCALRRNEAEHSWDCPCHGSRFDESGRLLNNPAKRGLNR